MINEKPDVRTPVEFFDEQEWSTVVLQPTWWDVVKLLFRRNRDIIFCWGQDQYAVRGVHGWEGLRAGGVPDTVRKDLKDKIFRVYRRRIPD